MVTAETITDEQIRRLHRDVFADEDCDQVDRQEIDLLEYRATMPPERSSRAGIDDRERSQARARCAELLNARAITTTTRTRST